MAKTKSSSQAAKPKKSGRAAKKAARKAAKPRRSFLGCVVGFTAKWMAVAAVWGVIVVGGMVAWYATDLPDVDAALDATRQPTVTLLAADGSELMTIGNVYGVPVRLSELPRALPDAVIATEDRRFRYHFGIDPIGLLRAAWANLRAGRIVQGGSTITQQVAKNLFLTPERSIKRKVQEVLLALWLEHRFTKDQILTLYLNRVYLGAGTYGVDAAAHKYFGVSARHVSTYQAAMLAGLLKAPSRYNPAANPKLADARTRIVLDNMVKAGYLSAKQARAAAADRNRRVAMRPRPGRSERYFADWVMDRIDGYVSPGDRDIVVKTTLDPTLQGIAAGDVARTLDGPGAKVHAGQAALVALAPDGAVRAMVGGRDYGSSQFNRATQALRQPGSAFKPIVYLAGLEAGLTPETMLSDAPVTVNGWTPHNFERTHGGPVTMEDALARSLNTVAVRVASKAGYGHVVDVARRLGITTELEATPALALGSSEVTLIELTAAMAPFANGGAGAWPYGITEIRDAAGHVLYARHGSGPGRVVPAREVAEMNRMLARVVTEGTGRAAGLSDRPAAGKTGTSQNYRDAWFVGFTANLVCGVWMGNDDGSAMTRVTGGSLPARLWHDFMQAAHRGVPPRPLPGGIEGPDTQESFWKRLMATIGGEG